MSRKAAGAFVICLDHGQARRPLFLQIYDTLRSAILDGRLAAGARLPSARTLARDLEISRTTSEEAYAQLQAEGFVVRRTGAGTFVAGIESVRRPRRGAQVRATTGPRRLSARAALLARHPCFPEDTRPRAFAAASPAVDLFPIHTWRSLMARTLRRAEHRALGSSDPAGFRPLREAIASYLAVSRGVVCTPERVIILASSQQALDLAIRVLSDPSDEAWMEEPGYPGAQAALLANGARIAPVPVDAHGMRVADGVRLAPRARLAYVTPSHQYPLGVTLSLERRLALLEWASAQGAWILEDDYDSEFRYNGRPLAAVQGIDSHQRVIYVGTFTKVLFPALRLAYAVVPEDLVDAFTVARGLTDGHPPAPAQIALADFFAEGHFGAHIRRMRELYRERRDTLVTTADRYLAGIELRSTDAGLHAVAHLGPHTNDRAVSERLARAGVDAQPLSRFYRGSRGAPGLFLGYGALSPTEISDAVQRMAGVL